MPEITGELSFLVKKQKQRKTAAKIQRGSLDQYLVFHFHRKAFKRSLILKNLLWI